jgi:DNA-binding protein YbaB
VCEKLATLVGKAASDDGRITVTCGADGGLSELHIDPRVMRMGSAELSKAILGLSAAARQDVRQQSQEIMEEVYGDQNPADLVRNKEELGESLKTLQKAFSGAMTDSMGELDQLRRRLQR